jgi:hypothetical protein
LFHIVRHLVEASNIGGDKDHAGCSRSGCRSRLEGNRGVHGVEG